MNSLTSPMRITRAFSRANEIYPSTENVEDEENYADNSVNKQQSSALLIIISENSLSEKLANKPSFCVTSLERKKYAEAQDEFEDLKKMYVDKCLICGFMSKAKDKAKRLSIGHRHMKVHMTLKPYDCNECGKSFLDSQRLESHETCHTDQLKFSCHFCAKLFKQKSLVRQHLQRVHAKTLNFWCEICSRKLSSRQTLRKHLLTHTGEKCHHCTECDRSFTASKDLKAHVDKHRGVTFKCDYCDKICSSLNYLRMHKALHIGKLWECKTCDKKFNFYSNLQQHMKTHSEMRSHECEQCGKTFKLPHHLRNHLETHKE